MLRPFPLRGCTTHREVLERSAKTGDLVPLEMGHHDHALRSDDITGDRDRFEMFFIDRNMGDILPAKTVGNDNRRPDYRVVKPVVYRGRDMVDCIRTASEVQRIRIRNKGQGARLFYFFHHLPEHRPG